MTHQNRLLVIASWLPKPDRMAGCRRFAHLLRLLRAQGPVDLHTWWSDSPWYNGDYSRYRKLLEDEDIHILGHTGQDLDAAMRQHRYRAIWCEGWENAARFTPRLRHGQPGVPILADCIDLEHRRLALAPDALDARHVATVRRRELAALAAADWIVTISDEERNILSLELPALKERMTILPILYQTGPTEPRAAEIPDLMLFVGSMFHAPNLDAVRWFCAHVLPRIRARRSDAVLRIIGEPPSDQALFPDGVPEGVESVGWVSDLGVHLAQAQISIAPLRYGAGMKGKVIEAFAVGPAVVTTTVGTQGMNVTSGVEALIVAPDDADAFAEATLRLLDSQSLRAEMCRAARSFVARTCSPELAAERIQVMLTQVQNLPVAHMGWPQRLAFGTWRRGVSLHHALRPKSGS